MAEAGLIDGFGIRRLQAADAPAYRALPLSWWASRLSAHEAATEEVWGAWQSSPDACAGTLVGAVGLSVETREKTRHKATLFGMVVVAAFRGRGLGRSLVQACLRAAAHRPGLRQIQLTVTESNASAVRLYESCGFQRFGLEPDAVRVEGGFVHKLHLWRRLP
jgi:ribosomal protein S18 acetylase RimI-like enzyme